MAKMTKVRMRSTSWTSKPGDIVEVDEARAEHLIREGHATAVEGAAAKKAAAKKTAAPAAAPSTSTPSAGSGTPPTGS
jgi:topoisomerase IA-like protein